MVIAVLNSVKAQPCVFENVERPLHQCLKCIWSKGQIWLFVETRCELAVCQQVKHFTINHYQFTNLGVSSELALRVNELEDGIANCVHSTKISVHDDFFFFLRSRRGKNESKRVLWRGRLKMLTKQVSLSRIIILARTRHSTSRHHKNVSSLMKMPRTNVQQARRDILSALSCHGTEIGTFHSRI